MEKVYINITEVNNANAIFVANREPVLAGTSVSIMDISDFNDEYRRFADEYDIQFIFEDKVPSIDFFTIPMVDIFAVDSDGGYIGSLGQHTNLHEDIPICYIDNDNKCYIVAKNGQQFLEQAHQWKKEIIPYTEIEFFKSCDEAKEKYEFLCLKKHIKY